MIHISSFSVLGAVGVMHIFGRRGNYCCIGGMNYVVHLWSSWYKVTNYHVNK